MQRTINLPITVIATDRAGMERGLGEAVAVARSAGNGQCMKGVKDERLRRIYVLNAGIRISTAPARVGIKPITTRTVVRAPMAP